MKRTNVNGNTSRRPQSLLWAVALGSAVLWMAAPAQAQTATGSMDVSATVSANCVISAGALAFGTYDPVVAHASANLDGTAALTITCTDGAAATITLGQGSNSDAGSTDPLPLRRMISGANYLSYHLYQETGRTTVWGNDAASDVEYTGTGVETVGTPTTTVYGRVPSGQNVPAGSYADTVVATISF